MRVLYVTTVSGTINQFLIPHIKMLKKNGYHVDIATHLTQEINDELIELGCKVFNIEFRRNPLNIVNVKAYKKIKKIIKGGKYDVVHTHTPVASSIVRLACKSNFNKTKSFYTAHGFHFFKGASFKNWIFYYPIEKILSKYTDVLITINEEDYKRALKKFNAKNTRYIPGVGLDIKKFQTPKVNKLELRKELGVSDKAFVILSVGELNKNKNHETIIKAIAKINNKNIYYIICGVGPYRKQLEQLIDKVNLNDKVKLLGFRKDVKDILNIGDLFVFPSYREGLPVSLMEAMAAQLPIVCSDIRGNNDLIKNNENGYLIKPNDIDGFKNSIEILYKSPEIRKRFIEKNRNTIEKYSIDSALQYIIEIYNEEIVQSKFN